MRSRALGLPIPVRSHANRVLVAAQSMVRRGMRQWERQRSPSGRADTGLPAYRPPHSSRSWGIGSDARACPLDSHADLTTPTGEVPELPRIVAPRAATGLTKFCA